MNRKEKEVIPENTKKADENDGGRYTGQGEPHCHC